MMTIMESLQSMAKAGIPGLYLVDHIPILKYIPSWFPGAEFKREAERGRKITDKLVYKPYNEVKDALVKDNTCLPEHHADQGYLFSARERQNHP